jgi:Protein of unknown function (DUF2958)
MPSTPIKARARLQARGQTLHPDAECTWLLTELDPDHELAFGLCDLGMGEPEIGYVSLTELRTAHGKLGLPVERDEDFDADRTLSAYADEARRHGRIVT